MTTLITAVKETSNIQVIQTLFTGDRKASCIHVLATISD